MFSHAGEREDCDLIAILQPELQQHCRQSNRTHHNYRQRAEECPAVGEQHDQSQGSAKQTGGDHRPATPAVLGHVHFHLERESPL